MPATTARRLRSGEDVRTAQASAIEAIAAAGFSVDYFETRHAETLTPVTSTKDGPLRILVAAKIGTTRLIDNIAV